MGLPLKVVVPLLLANSMNFMGFNSEENAGLVIPTVVTVLKQIRAQLRAAATPVSCVVVLGTTQFIRLEI